MIKNRSTVLIVLEYQLATKIAAMLGMNVTFMCTIIMASKESVNAHFERVSSKQFEIKFCQRFCGYPAIRRVREIGINVKAIMNSLMLSFLHCEEKCGLPWSPELKYCLWFPCWTSQYSNGNNSLIWWWTGKVSVGKLRRFSAMILGMKFADLLGFRALLHLRITSKTTRSHSLLRYL